MTAPDDHAASGASGSARALPPELSPRRRQTRAGVVLLTVVACLGASGILATAAVGYAGLGYTSASLVKVQGDVITAKGKGPKKLVSKAQNILIVGSDSRIGLTRKQQAALHVGSTKTAEGERSDVMMLLHIGAGAKKAELVSFPRDSWVLIPEHKENGKVVTAHHAKINDAFHSGGAALAVDTVQELTKIRIDHYVEINFLAFVNMIDAVGKVDICTPTALKDKDSGLDIPPGVSHLDSTMALKYARARHIDDDFGRIGRQQKLIAAILRKATSTGVLTNPRKLSRLVNAAISAVHVDKGFDKQEIVTLTSHLSSLSPSNLVFVDLPVADPAYYPNGNGPGRPEAVQLNNADAAVIYDRILHDEEVGAQPKPSASASASATPTAPGVTKAPSTVRVRVLNGSGVVGMGKKGATDLAAAGFNVIGAARNAPTSGASVTTIKADPIYTESVKTLQAALPGAVVEPVEGLGRTFQVVVGSTYTGVTPVTVTSKATASASASPSPTVTTHTAADSVC